MDARSHRWHRVTPSTFPWEDEAIDFLRTGIADVDPNRAWSNFEFISGGSISEVDVLLLTRKGAFLIEIKSTPGRLVGDQQSWTFFKPDGGRTTMENPLLGANRKAKRLKTLLQHKWRSATAGAGNAADRPPFIQPLVFLSDPDLQVDLAPDARRYICGRDGSSVCPPVSGGDGAGNGDGRKRLDGIVATVAQLGALEANDPRFRQLNTPTTSAVAKALDSIGIKESDRTRRIGSWILRLDTVTERPGIQDFLADHQSTQGVTRRVRIYSRQPLMPDEQATSLRRAAEREFLATERLHHPNVVAALDRIDTELGSAVVFEHDPSAVRLDHWLDHADGLDIDDRLSVLRQLAETLHSVHRRKVTHRALSPGSVLVRPGGTGEPAWVVSVTDFSLAGRSNDTGNAHRSRSMTGTRGNFGLPSASPGDVELLADEGALRYQAPEVFTDDAPDGVALDVFSFGAIAFHVLAGKPAGDSHEAVRRVLQAGRGLQLATAMPGVADPLNDLVFEATRPLVSERTSSFDDVLAGLDLVEEELTAPTPISIDPEPAEAAEIDPLDAKVGDQLGNGSVVRRRLGRGSTAVALLVAVADPDADDDSALELVYKVGLGGDADQRLREEGRILGGLRHPGVVERFGQIQLAGRPVLVEALAGTASVADELRRNGTPGIEFLQRWGTDLLDALRYLDREGRSHRDLKPDNLGITEVGANKEQHLVLFDFSLAAVPSTDIRAGTPPYLDPFLVDRRPPQWDLAAERYAAAVTLYEMATGELPRWGDGASDPSFTTEEVTLDAVLFDPAARDGLEHFFATALRRDPLERFGNAEEMLRAWERLFDDIDVTRPSPEDQPAPPPSDGAEPGEPTITLSTGLALDDPIVSLGASGKVLSALSRLDVATVRQMAELAPMQVNRARRISPRVRRRIIELRAAVLKRFADDLAGTPSRRASKAEEVDRSAGAGAEAAVGSEPATPTVPDLDALVPLLLPAARQRGPKGSTLAAVRMMLGLDGVPGAEGADWPTQSAIADALGITRGRLGQIGPKVRKHWAELRPLAAVADDLLELLTWAGGVAAVSELEPLLVESLGSGLDPDDALEAARAVIRATVEADEHAAHARPAKEGGSDGSRFVIRRRGERVIVALAGGTDVGEGPDAGIDALLSGFEHVDAAALLGFAAALGDRADEVVSINDDVIPQDRALGLLAEVAAPTGSSLSDGRRLRLAAACSQQVGIGSGLELYPRTLDAARAVRLSRQGLASATNLTVEEIRARVRARFPLVELPDRPDLDAALAAADVALTWNGSTQRFERPESHLGDLTTFTSVAPRAATRHASAPPRRTPRADVDPDVAAAQDLEGRLQRSLELGGFLALRVNVGRRQQLRRELARFTGAPHRMVTVDVEQVFLDEFRRAAAARNITWAKLLEADLAAPGTVDHSNLRILTHEAVAAVEQHILAAGDHVLAWNPGVLARYDEMGVIDRLRDCAGHADVNLRTLWLVVFGSTADARPMIDGQPVPVIGGSEWVDVTEAWLLNRHRSDAPTGTTGRVIGQKGSSP